MNQDTNKDTTQNQAESAHKVTDLDVDKAGSILEYLKDRHDDSPDAELDSFLSQSNISQLKDWLWPFIIEFLNVAANRHFSQPSVRRDSPQAEFQLDPEPVDDEGSLEQLEDEEITEKQITYTKLIIENDKLIVGSAFSYEYPQVAGIILQLLDIRDKYVVPTTECNQYSFFSQKAYCIDTNIPNLIEFKAPSSEPIVNYLKDDSLPPKLENVFLLSFQQIISIFRLNSKISVAPTSLTSMENQCAPSLLPANMSEILLTS